MDVIVAIVEQVGSLPAINSESNTWHYNMFRHLGNNKHGKQALFQLS